MGDDCDEAFARLEWSDFVGLPRRYTTEMNHGVLLLDYAEQSVLFTEMPENRNKIRLHDYLFYKPLTRVEM